MEAVVVPQGVPSNAKRCVTDLIDHMITESKGLYKGMDVEMFNGALA